MIENNVNTSVSTLGVRCEVQRLPSDQGMELAVIEGITDVVEDEAAKLVASRTLESAHTINLEGL
ncbi:hypothetical protein GYB43_07175 [bacterium]|nr:hypothetical protein [bacterium]